MNQPSISMNTDKAYLLGLIIGGGKFSGTDGSFSIDLPFKKWGSYTSDPVRAGGIAKDILSKVGQMFRAVYNLSVNYETVPSGNWKILFVGDLSQLKNDLLSFGINPAGSLRGNVDLTPVINSLLDNNTKRRFIAGLADTVGSVAKSHRRFTDEHQIISFEFPGYNYKFICDLCNLLYSINCIPDQVNWNHPNIHATSDPHYNQWKKGFKIRVLLDQYAKFGSFAFKTKAESSKENLKSQKATHIAQICEDRDFHVTPSTVHPAEHNSSLPPVIRDGHYIHFRHFCAVLGCPHAPYQCLTEKFKNIGDFINPFPILHKGDLAEIEHIVDSKDIYRDRIYNNLCVSVKSMLDEYNKNQYSLMYSKSDKAGYPLTVILQGIAYVIASDIELRGSKIKGKYIELIEKHLRDNPDLTVTISIPDLLTPIIIKGIKRAALVGPQNPEVYEKLVSIDDDNDYKLIVRDIEEKDLL